MEYYYCPGLLKLLRYLWVSAAARRPVSSSSPSPPASCQARFLALPASSVSVFFNKRWLFWGGGEEGKGRDVRESLGVLTPLGISGREQVAPGRDKNKPEKQGSVRVFRRATFLCFKGLFFILKSYPPRFCVRVRLPRLV